MNILPFVFSFFVILALVGTTLLRKTAFLKQEAESLFGLLQAEANIRTLQARKKMRQIPKIEKEPASADAAASVASTQEGKQEKAEEEEDDEPAVEEVYFRNKNSALAGKKLQIRKLIENPKTSNLAYGAAVRLFKSLYGSLPFWQEAKIPSLEEKLVDALIENRDKPLADLIGKDPKLGPIFYTILKGSNTYNVKTHQGIPPLLDFIDFEEKGSRFVYFLQAHRLVLEAFLGPQVAGLIEAEEIVENKPLTEEKFDALLQKKLNPLDAAAAKELFYFMQPPKEQCLLSIHEATGIAFRL